MKISELIKKIRIEHGYSFQEMGNKLGFSKGMISAIEREDSPVSKNLVEAYIKNYPLYKKELIKSYLEQFMPENSYRHRIEDEESFQKSLLEYENINRP